ncbi:hypothetical protein [Aestuariivirga litoralis]|uniref:hypothetical protein n=1 Tax=Aestuariivirga litoralis TaxID=2650924 RepID=UPI0018C690CC|nr:hypothetical protein [Aestuariivirga litoralis]MBG1230977.1 hypothetical protein [Aestuariivirga litoralis]
MKALLVIAALLLAACTDGSSLLEKPAPQQVTSDSLVTPPWQTMVRAGPGAEKDIDYETLDGVPQPSTDAPPPLSTADMAQAKPEALPLDTKPAAPAPDAKPTAKPDAKPGTAINAVAVVAVTGGSAQGSKDLTLAMRKVLRDAGWPVVDKPRPDALIIRGKVALDAANGPSQAVHITWAIASPKGKDLGVVSQNNDVPAHSLDGAWGQTADFAAQAASDGIFKLIAQYR